MLLLRRKILLELWTRLMVDVDDVFAALDFSGKPNADDDSNFFFIGDSGGVNGDQIDGDEEQEELRSNFRLFRSTGCSSLKKI